VTATTPQSSSTTQLAPSYLLPVALVIAAVPLILVQRWVALAVGLFGLFLLVQAATLRLCFTTSDLDIYRGDRLIRRFPYQDWLNWRIFWSPVPILFYFREVKSVHFLPILFDPKQLQTCLQQHCPYID
jgi:hypothetical protein